MFEMMIVSWQYFVMVLSSLKGRNHENDVQLMLHEKEICEVGNCQPQLNCNLPPAENRICEGEGLILLLNTTA